MGIYGLTDPRVCFAGSAQLNIELHKARFNPLIVTNKLQQSFCKDWSNYVDDLRDRQ